MTYFLNQPDGIFLRSNSELLSVTQQLEPKTYIVKRTPVGEYFLVATESFKRPKKLYGNTATQAARIVNTFNDRKGSTGVLLSGQQGSGKTMLARELSILCRELGIATIIVSDPFCGTEFNSFIQSIDMPAVVLFDEFEKVYDSNEQEEMLTLLDGVYQTKKLFLLTANKTNRVDEHLFNRPGRIYYHLNYSGLDKGFVIEYAEDTLKDLAKLDSILTIYSIFNAFTFDMLQALIEEMNRYDLDAVEALEMLNISTEHDNSNYGDEYSIKLLTKAGKNLLPDDETWDGNPTNLESKIQIGYTLKNDYVRKYFSTEDFVSAKDGVFTFAKDNLTLLLIKNVPKKFNYRSLF